MLLSDYPKDLATMEDSFIDPSWCYLPLFLQRFQEGNKDLVATHVGRGKDSLDAVDSNIGVAEVVPLFGLFVRYTVKSIDEATSTCNCSGKILANSLD